MCGWCRSNKIRASRRNFAISSGVAATSGIAVLSANQSVVADPPGQGDDAHPASTQHSHDLVSHDRLRLALGRPAAGGAEWALAGADFACRVILLGREMVCRRPGTSVDDDSTSRPGEDATPAGRRSIGGAIVSALARSMRAGAIGDSATPAVWPPGG